MGAVEEIKAGYKKTKLGLIPEEWEVVKLEQKIILTSGQHLSAKQYSRYKIGFPYFTGPTDFVNDIKLVSKWTSYKTKFGLKNNILITVKGSGVGKLSILSLEKVALGRQLMSINTEEGYNLYFYYYLSTKEALFKALSSGNLIPGISRKDILKSEIPLPPLPEQKKIADILSTWDKAIETTQALLQKLQLRKKGLMQQLLSGKKRLLGFSGEWEIVKASELFANHTDKSHNGEFEVLSATQAQGVIPRSQTGIDIKYEKSSLTNYKKVDKGDFVISLRSFQGGIEYSRFIGLVSPAYTVLKEKVQIDKTFYRVYFKTDTFIQRLNSIIYGIRDGKQISYRDFSSLKLYYPPVEEQVAIGRLIAKADEEINQTQNYLDQLQAQKKGLMQQLLTGQKRVRV